VTSDLDYLTIDDLLEIAQGVIGDFRVRDLGLLESAVARPRSVVFGADAYQTFAEKTAALMHSIARNHALIDGNKRLAWAAGRVFCFLNGRELHMDIDAAEALVVGMASGSLDVPGVASELDRAITTAR
jgi:death-on-curing protein